MSVNLDLEVRLAVYRHFVATGGRPSAEETAAQVTADVAAVLETYRRLRDQRILVPAAQWWDDVVFT